MKNFSFIKNKYLFLGIALVVIVAGAASMLIRGFNVDIDFLGGTEISCAVGESIDKEGEDALASALRELVGGEIFSSASVIGDTRDQVVVSLKVSEASAEVSQTREQIKDKIVELYPNTDEKSFSTDTVSAEVSDDLKEAAFVSTALAVLLMLVYIAFRFEISSAFAAVLCLIHDVFVVIAAYSVFQIPVNINIIAVILTILGYSINATIIIFDRVRENGKTMGRATPFADKVDAGIKQTVTRSLNTTLTTLFTIGMVYVLGVTSIKEFALPLIIGLFAGLYSSVCLSGIFWHSFKKSK